MKIQTLLREDMIIPEISASDRDSALQEMVRYLVSRNRIGKEKDLFEKLIQREKLGSTAIGDGIAIPHCKLKEAQSPILALGISKVSASMPSTASRPTSSF